MSHTFDHVLKLNQDATELMKSGRHSQAVTLLIQAERCFSASNTGKSLQLHRVVCNNLGCCYMKSKDRLLAAKYLRKALEIPGESEQEIGTRLNLSAVYYQLGEHNLALVEALKSLHLVETKAVHLKEDRLYAKALNSAGMGYEALGQRRKAILHYFRGFCTAEEHLGPSHDLTQTLKTHYTHLSKGTLQPHEMLNLAHLPLFTKRTQRVGPKQSSRNGSLHPLRSPEGIKHTSSTPKLKQRQRGSPSGNLSSTVASSKDMSMSRINRNALISPPARKQRSLRARAPSESCIKVSGKNNSSDMEQRIHSIDEKLLALTQRLWDYGRKNSVVKEIAAKAVTQPSGMTTPGSDISEKASSAVLIQRCIRGFLARRKVQKMQKTSFLLRSRTAKDSLKFHRPKRILRHSLSKPI